MSKSRDYENYIYLKCTHCDFVTLDHFDFRDHFAEHHAEELFIYKCYNCQFETTSSIEIMEHVATHVSSVVRYKCDKCDDMDTDDVDAFDRHMKQHKVFDGQKVQSPPTVRITSFVPAIRDGKKAENDEKDKEKGTTTPIRGKAKMKGRRTTKEEEVEGGDIEENEESEDIVEVSVSSRSERTSQGTGKPKEEDVESDEIQARDDVDSVSSPRTNPPSVREVSTDGQLSFSNPSRAKNVSSEKESSETATPKHAKGKRTEAVTPSSGKKRTPMGTPKDSPTLKRFACQEPNCTYATNVRQELEYHMNMHLGLKPFRCPHPGCNYAASHRKNLSHHQMWKH